MAYFMDSSLSRIPALSVNGTPDDPLFRALGELFNDPEVEEAVSGLRLKIIDRLLMAAEPVEGLELGSGYFVREGIEDRLREARGNLSAIGIEMVIGSVDLFDAHGRTSIGQIAVPHRSDWARQNFINTNPIKDVEKFVFTPYTVVSPYVSPREVTKDSPPPAFLLSDREGIAAQILMVVSAALAYRDIAEAVATEENPDRTLRIMKVSANMRDLYSALQYAVKLKQKLHEVPLLEPSERMILGMSEAARNLTHDPKVPE